MMVVVMSPNDAHMMMMVVMMTELNRHLRHLGLVVRFGLREAGIVGL